MGIIITTMENKSIAFDIKIANAAGPIRPKLEKQLSMKDTKAPSLIERLENAEQLRSQAIDSKVKIAKKTSEKLNKIAEFQEQMQKQLEQKAACINEKLSAAQEKAQEERLRAQKKAADHLTKVEFIVAIQKEKN